jgi:hypothetical protein
LIEAGARTETRYLRHRTVRKIYTATAATTATARQMAVFKTIYTAGALFALFFSYPWRTETRPGV